MGVKEDGIVGVRKKEKKSKEKSKKVKNNEVSGNGIDEAPHGGNDLVVEGGKSAEKEDVERGDNNKKKKKKKKVKNELSEESHDIYVNKEKGNNDSEESELGGGRKHDGYVMEKVERKKRKREKDKSISSDNRVKGQDLENAEGGSQLYVDGTSCDEMQNGKDVEAIGSGDVVNKVEKKRKKKKIKIEAALDALQEVNTYLIESGPQENKNQRIEGIELEAFGEDRDLDSIEKQGKKKRKREKKNKTDICGVTQDILAEEYTEGNANSTMNEKGDSDLKNRSKGKRTKAKSVDNASEDPKRKNSKKRVRFSDDVEVFPPSNGLLRGKRFSKEEDELVKEAVFKYIEVHCLGEGGLKMVLNCKSHPEIRDCWKEIATALRYRPQSSVYYRAQILFRRDEKHKWTEEEIDLVRKFQEKHGNQWKVLADELGKHRFHVKDTWRRIRHKNVNKGRWSQEEYQALFDLVNTDLRMKYSEDKKSKHGMLRDNIAWTAISDKLSTRTDANCCLKWYNQLTSSMVAEGVWADADDYRLTDALFQLDASCSEDVDWDNLLDHRPGDICRKRWNQMVLHIGDNGNKSFADQVELLAKRYCPDLLEVRESWDSKHVVP